MFSAHQKTQIALEALRERQSLSEIAQKHSVHPSQITAWKKQATDGLQTLFEHPLTNQTQQQDEKIALLYQQIGQLQFELDWLKKKLLSHETAYLRTLIDPDSPLPFARQCELLGLPRSSFYYQPIGESTQNLQLMRLLDEQHLRTPFFGVGQYTDWLREKGHVVNPKRIRRLLRLLDLQAVCPGPHTSKPGTGVAHKVYPYLLRHVTVSYVGQVYGTDITARAAPVHPPKWGLSLSDRLCGLVQPVCAGLGIVQQLRYEFLSDSFGTGLCLEKAPDC